jgi:hypothetical protein
MGSDRGAEAAARRAIEPQRRRYGETEQNGLRGLFGDRERWVETLKPFLWMQCNTTVQGFTGRTEADLALPRTYDLADPALLGDGLHLGHHRIRCGQIPWACEARYQLPVQVWREMIASYFPNTGWLRVDSDVLDQLAEHRARHGLTSWDETMHKLLAAAGEATS